MRTRLMVLADQLVVAGIPIFGTTDKKVDYAPEATAQNIVDGNAMLAAFDFREKRKRSDNDIITDIGLLSTGQRDDIMKDIMVDFLSKNNIAAQKYRIDIEE